MNSDIMNDMGKEFTQKFSMASKKKFFKQKGPEIGLEYPLTTLREINRYDNDGEGAVKEKIDKLRD